MFGKTSSRASNVGSPLFQPYLLVALLVFVGLAGSTAWAQISGTGAISGTVQDPTGAVVPDAIVTATNIDTNVDTERKTTRAGDYNITPLLPGTYTVTVAATGFEKFRQENVTVNALQTVAVNVKLTVGQATETVTVSTAPPLLETTDATLGAAMDNEMYSSLPLQMGAGGNNGERRSTDFEYLMPGVQANSTHNNNTDNSGIVNGSGPAGGVSEIYIDGINLPMGDQVGDPRFTSSDISVESVNQFQVDTAGVSSQYAGQGLENYSVKSGGNAIHGSIYEYDRNTIFDAWQFANKVPTLNAAGQTIQGGIKPREIQNEFGIVLSGPILKNKLFLFGNYGEYRNQNGAKYSPMTIPTAAMLGLTQSGTALGYADFTQYARANGNSHCTSVASEGTGGVANTATGGSGPANGYGCNDIYDPSTETLNCTTCTRTPFHGMLNGVDQNDVIPGSRLSQTAQYINKFWIPYEQLANQNTYANNLNYGTPTGLSNWYSAGRIDYNQSSRNQISLIVAFGRGASTGPNSASGLGPPFNVSQIVHPVTNVDILKDTYTISAHLVNQAAFGYGRYESVSETPDDAPPYTAAALGLLTTPAGQASDGFPEITGMGGPTLAGYAWNSKVSNTYSSSDNVQWQYGKHNFTFGGQYVDEQFNYFKALGPTGPMVYGFSGSQTAGFTSGTTLLSGTGNGTASYMIGAVSSASVEDLLIPGLGSRWRTPSFWGQDDWKATDKLTLNLGLRWDIFPSIKEAHNIFTWFNPVGTNSITGNLGTLYFAGNGNPTQYCNCTSPSPTYLGMFGPRVGLAYAIDRKTVIRGSYTVNYARGNWNSGQQSGSPEQTGVTPSGSTPVVTTPDFPVIYWDGTACSNGTAAGVNCGFNGLIAPPGPPTAAATNAPVPGATLAEYGTGNNSVTGTSTTTSTGTTVSLASGAGVDWFDRYAGAKTPQFINWTFGVQRQLTRDISISVSYVGSQGHYISGGFDPLNRHNALPTSFAALAGYNVSGSTATPCSGLNCPVPLLTTKASQANIALFESLGFNPQNQYTGGVTYPTTSSTTGYFTAYPQYGVSDTTNFHGNTNWNALEISLRSRPSHGVDFMLNYTYSKTIDDLGSFRLNDNPRLDRGISSTDQPQVLTATAVYMSPFGKGSMASENIILRSIAKDWSLSGIFSYGSGYPVTFTGTGCPSTPLGTCMPSVVPGVNVHNVSYNKPPGGIEASTSAPNYYGTIHHFDLNAFTVLDATNSTPTNTQQQEVGLGTAAYVPGNAAREAAGNTWGMGSYDLDLGLKRTFPIWENVKLQFEVDMLNATNHVVFPAPSGAVGNGSASQTNGVISGTTSYGLIGAPTNLARDFQLSGRVSW